MQFKRPSVNVPIEILIEELKLDQTLSSEHPLSAVVFDVLFAFMYELRIQDFSELEDLSVQTIV